MWLRNIRGAVLRRPLLLIIAVFLMLSGIVNPIREIHTGDDGWAYARSVKHLLKTGEYKLDNWAAANMPTQIYMSAAFAHLFGYSVTLLRLTTLLMLIAGTLAFYGILRECRIHKPLAASMTLALLCCPMILWLSFTFMTDVQFLGWLLVTCWLTIRGLRQGRVLFMSFSGLTAALATGTRVFGFAIVIGLLFSCFLNREQLKRSPVTLFAAGVPAAAVFAWQVLFANKSPTFTQSVRLAEQAAYISQKPTTLAFEVLRRCTVLVEYLGLFLVPILIGFVALTWQVRRPRVPGINSVLQSAILFLAALVGWRAVTAFRARGSVAERLSVTLMPTTTWLVGKLISFHFPAYDLNRRAILTALACISGAAWCALTIRWVQIKQLLDRRNAIHLFLVGTGTAFLAVHLTYVQFHDTYLVTFVPFVLIAVALAMQSLTAPRCVTAVIAVSSIIIGILAACCIRGDFNRDEALWRAAEQLRRKGVNSTSVVDSDWTWFVYHGGFDRWIHGPGGKLSPQQLAGRFHERFFAWAEQERSQAEYSLYPCVSDSVVPERVQFVQLVPYRDAFLRLRYICILHRQRQHGSR